VLLNAQMGGWVDLVGKEKINNLDYF